MNIFGGEVTSVTLTGKTTVDCFELYNVSGNVVSFSGDYIRLYDDVGFTSISVASSRIAEASVHPCYSYCYVIGKVGSNANTIALNFKIPTSEMTATSSDYVMYTDGVVLCADTFPNGAYQIEINGEEYYVPVRACQDASDVQVPTKIGGTYLTEFQWNQIKDDYTEYALGVVACTARTGNPMITELVIYKE